MKKSLLSLFALTSFGLLAFTAVNELPIGSSIPKADVKMKDISGKDVSLKDALKKNGLLVMFSCNTCPYVVKNESRTREISKYATENNVGVIIVNSNEAYRSSDDSYDAMKEYGKKQGYKWYYVVDKNSELADAFGAKRTPECFLFDNSGKLVYHGAIDDNPSNASAVGRNHLKVAIDEMTAGKEISIKTSRSVGCTIKRIE
ncbi:MAG TPA: thioredoxin family protein [Flavisolibacter sp.]|nr:thioredoxin family protein [Flavisolibacter sp.]